MSRIGVLGGMGPSATVDFMDKIIQLTPATRDQEHLPVIVANLPHVPRLVVVRPVTENELRATMKKA